MIKEVDARQARESLLAKGFWLSEKGNRDHEMYIFMLDGQKTRLHFKVSHGARAVRQDEIKNSARKPFGMLGDDLYKILCCTHDPAETRRILAEVLAGPPPR